MIALTFSQNVTISQTTRVVAMREGYRGEEGKSDESIGKDVTRAGGLPDGREHL